MTNYRYTLFEKLYKHEGRKWRTKQSLNAAYISFISKMVTLFTGASSCLDPNRVITDQEKFTKFIENYVDSKINNS